MGVLEEEGRCQTITLHVACSSKRKFTLWKARLVNGGHMTDPKRYDPFEKTAPTVSLEIVLCQLNIALSKNLNIVESRFKFFKMLNIFIVLRSKHYGKIYY